MRKNIGVDRSGYRVYHMKYMNDDEYWKIVLWPISFPFGCLVYIYLGIGAFLYKIQKRLLDITASI